MTASQKLLILPAILLSGCLYLPQADVRHSHARVRFVEGAEVVSPPDPIQGLKVRSGVGWVLLVFDVDGNPTLTDTGNDQVLMVECRDDRPVRAMLSRGGAMGGPEFGEELQVSGKLDCSLGRACALKLHLSGRWSKEAFSWTHTFVGESMPFDRFRKENASWAQ